MQIFVLCASCRLTVAAESAEQREVAANERTSRDRLAAESPQLAKLRERGQATADEGQTGC